VFGQGIATTIKVEAALVEALVEVWMLPHI